MEEKEKNPAVVEEEEDDILDPDDFEDEEDSEDGDEDDSEKPQEEETSEEDKEKEEKAKNAKAAQARRRKEAKLKAQKEREAREKQIREEAAINAELGLLKINPYTEEPIVDAEDLKIYKLQKELDEEGKDPINDLPKRIAERNRNAAKEAKDKEEQTKREQEARLQRINEEIKELRAKYPKVNTAELAQDPLFQKCLEGRAGRWSQVEIYELYLSEKEKAEKKAQEEQTDEAAKRAGKKISTPPSSSSRGNSPQKKPIDEMTPEEFERYFQEKYS